MTDRVIIPLPGIGTLELSREAYEAALRPIDAALPSSGGPEPLLDPEQLAAALSLPLTWVEQAARERKIPSIQAGRWRRFQRSAVERALLVNGKHV